MPSFPAGVGLKLRINGEVYDPYKVEETVAANTPFTVAVIIENNSASPVRISGGLLYAFRQSGVAANLTTDNVAVADDDVDVVTNPEVAFPVISGDPDRTSYAPSGSIAALTIEPGDTGALEFQGCKLPTADLHYITFLARLGDGSIQKPVTARLRIS